MLDTIEIVSTVVNALQGERGCSVVVSQSRGALFSERLLEQRNCADVLLDQLQLLMKSGLLLKTETAEAPRVIQLVLAHLESQRGQVLEQADTDLLIHSFSQQIIAPLIALNISMTEHSHAPEGQVKAFQHFVHWKERMALERGYGVKSFFHSAAENDETQVIRVLIRKQLEFERAFLAVADQEQLQQLRANSSEVGPVIDLTHSLLQSPAGVAAIAPLTVEGWYELLSKRLDEMHQIELRLISHLRESVPDEDRAQAADLPVRLEPHRQAILHLPLLNNIGFAVREKLLHRAKVLQCADGLQIISSGEGAEYLHIVLEGWVKICSHNARGDEAILQMIGRGDSVVDAPVYRNVVSSVDAVVEHSAVLLQIPANTVRACLTEDGVLQTNALQRLSVRSQRQLQHIERIRLKSARERVGWFLLSLRIEMDSVEGNDMNSIVLPYNKATIASYLHMTPETFSRTLKSFRDSGIRVDRQWVTLDDPHSLCLYCDHEQASLCKYYKPGCQLIENSNGSLVVEFQ